MNSLEMRDKMKLLYGTGNPAKLDVMKNRLKKLGIELIGLNNLKAEGISIPKVPEDGHTPLENQCPGGGPAGSPRPQYKWEMPIG